MGYFFWASNSEPLDPVKDLTELVNKVQSTVPSPIPHCFFVGEYLKLAIKVFETTDAYIHDHEGHMWFRGKQIK